MKSNLLLSAVAAACLALPAAALADPPSDQQNPAADKKDQPRHQAKGAERGKPSASEKQGGPDRQSPASRGAAPDVRSSAAGRQDKAHGGPPPQDRQPPASRGAAPEASSSAPGRQDKERGGPSPQTGSGGPPPVLPHAERGPPAPEVRRTVPNVPSAPAQESRREVQPQTQSRPAARPAPPPPLGDWRPAARGSARDQAGQQWRQQYQSWDRSAPWRQTPDWWRSDSGFRLYVGPRIGFFFVPQMGYIAIPRQYRSHHWRAGDYLPGWFRRYTVRDYGYYGLPRPPRGCVWIWLNGDVALIDRSDGYILDIAHNVW